LLLDFAVKPGSLLLDDGQDDDASMSQPEGNLSAPSGRRISGLKNSCRETKNKRSRSWLMHLLEYADIKVVTYHSGDNHLNYFITVVRTGRRTQRKVVTGLKKLINIIMAQQIIITGKNLLMTKKWKPYIKEFYIELNYFFHT
jgi:hypothetical protein